MKATAEALGIEVATSIPARRVIRVMEQLIEMHGKPSALRVDNGSELTSSAFTEWCEAQGIELHFIEPGKPDQNAYIERFNRMYREEVLDAYVFDSIEQVRDVTEALTGELTIASEVAGSFGFESDKWTAPTSGPAELLARYKRRDQETGYQRIAIQVIRMKDTGEVSTWVINRDGHSDEIVTARVEAALLEAFASALPSRRIVVGRR